jgi:hypothetical protein
LKNVKKHLKSTHIKLCVTIQPFLPLIHTHCIGDLKNEYSYPYLLIYL